MSEFQKSRVLRPLFLRVFLLLVVAGFVPSLAAQSAPSNGRITDAIDERQLVELKGQVNNLVHSALPGGGAPADLAMERMTLLLGSSPAQQASLEELLAEQQNPVSPNYRHWLTPPDFGEQFGPAPSDLETITAWLRGHGFRVNAVAQGRRFIEFSGTAAQVAEAFHTQVNSYVLDGEQYWANATNPYIPAALAPVVTGIASLHNFPRRAMHGNVGQTSFARAKATAAPEFNLSNGAHVLGPYDFAAIYNVLPLWNASPSTDGTGQTIAIVARSNIDPANTADFQSLFGLPAKPPQIFVNGPDPGILRNNNGTLSGDAEESELDVQWSGAVAKGATILLVVSQSTNAADGIDLSAAYIVDHNLAPVVSMSYGNCEPDDSQGSQSYNLLWQQAAAQGMSVFVSASDSGSAACDDPSNNYATHGLAVNGLASTPYNVAVGGTQFNENGAGSSYWSSTQGAHLASAKNYIPEVAWNETTAAEPGTGSGLWASGGGVSTLYSRPAWQTGTGVPTYDPGSTNQQHRLLPDVSLTAATHDGYVVCLYEACGSGTVYLMNGTSASAQAFAGLMAIVDQYTSALQGNPNFHFYPLSNTSGVYHDVVTGSNAVPCSGGSPGCSSTNRNSGPGVMTKYPAGPGYDLATGWGSVDANALVTNWSNVQFTPQIAFSANFYSANPVAPGSSLSFTVQFSNSTSGPAPFGTLNILDGSTSLWSATPSVGAGALVTLNTPTAPFSVGTHNLTLTYSGDANWLAASSNTITVTIANPDFALTVNPSVSVVRGAAARVSISTSSIAGFAGSMSLSCSGLPAETSYSFSPASPTVSSGANLTITTTAPRTASLRQGQRPRRVSWPASTGLILSGVVLLAGGRGRRRYWYVALALLLAAFLIADVGCGGGSTSSTSNSAATQASTSDAGTPTGTYTVTVTATSGALTHSTTFSLTVN